MYRIADTQAKGAAIKYYITINDDDYLKFNIFYTYHAKGGRRSIRITQLVLPVFSFFFILIQAFIVPYRCLGPDKDRIVAFLTGKGRSVYYDEKSRTNHRKAD